MRIDWDKWLVLGALVYLWGMIFSFIIVGWITADPIFLLGVILAIVCAAPTYSMKDCDW